MSELLRRKVEALEREMLMIKRQLARVPVVVGGGGGGGGGGKCYISVASEAELPVPPPKGVVFAIRHSEHEGGSGVDAIWGYMASEGWARLTHLKPVNNNG